MPIKLVLLTYESWADLYRAIEGLTAEEATTRSHGSSTVAWTLGHVTHMVDSWINVRFQGQTPHPVIDSPSFPRRRRWRAPGLAYGPGRGGRGARYRKALPGHRRRG